MDLFSDLKSALQNDLTVNSDSTLFDPTTTIPLAINRAYRKIGGAHPWPQLDDDKTTSTINGQEYYDSPSNWYPGSIYRLRVGGVSYGPDGQPFQFRDYQWEVENDFPSNFKQIWTQRANHFFIRPVPTANGNNDIEISGSKVVDKLVNDADTTIFSYQMPEVNEAILLEAAAILRTKTGDEPVMLVRYFEGTYLLSLEARQIVDHAWAQIKVRDTSRQKTMPQFDVPDFFGPAFNPNKKIGDF